MTKEQCIDCAFVSEKCSTWHCSECDQRCAEIKQCPISGEFADNLFKENIKIEGHIGKWHSIENKYFGNHMLYLMEHNDYGDEAACVIIDEDNNIVVEDVFNGFDELWDSMDTLEMIDKANDNIIELSLVWYKENTKFIILSVTEKYSEDNVYEFARKLRSKEGFNGYVHPDV